MLQTAVMMYRKEDSDGRYKRAGDQLSEKRP